MMADIQQYHVYAGFFGIALVIGNFIILLMVARNLKKEREDIWIEIGRPSLLNATPFTLLKLQLFLFSDTSKNIQSKSLQRNVVLAKYSLMFTLVYVALLFFMFR